MNYIKKQLGSYNLHMIKTDKFKRINMEIIFSNYISKDKITLNNFLSSMLTFSTKKYPTKNKFARELENLYVAKIFPSTYRIGKYHNIDFNLTMLNEKYTENGMFEKTLDFLKEIIFNPNVVNGEFDLNSFNIVKNDQLSQIERFKEDSRRYSILKLFELVDKNAPFAQNLCGDKEELEKINPKNLYEYYKDFIEKSHIDIFIVGDIDFDKTEKLIREKFKFRVFKNELESPILESFKHRKKYQEVFEKDKTNQSKLNVAFTIEDMTKFEREYVLNLYNIILGGTADSKFFKNIREKYSLCYYISSIGNKLDNLLIVNSGITKENYSKILILVKKEMEDMQKGIFSLEDIEKAQKYYIASLNESLDSPSQIIASYYAMNLMGIDDIETRKEKIMTVNKEDIVKLSKKIYLDTVFLLGGDKNE